MQFHSRDIQILRQSQSKMVLEYLNSLNVQVTVEELQRITDIFVECCLRPSDDDLKKRIKSLDKWINEKIEEKKSIPNG
jgi:hypothetical protein